uniref:E3 ubiquitin-protein ligase ZNRF1 n=1 Tax=Acrobeloides nanus TaxID=290746 RepID=A0A914D8F8_9BILA
MGARQSLQPDVERRPRSNSAVENGVEVPIPSSRRTNSQLPPRTQHEQVQSHYSSDGEDDSDDNSGPGPSSQTVHSAAGLRFSFRPTGRTSLLQALSGTSSRRDRSSIPVLHFLGHDIKCPVCHKRVPSDEAEVHLVMCFTRPKIAYNEDVLTDDKGECSICLDDMSIGDTIARLPCLCIYHKSCIDEWFKRKNSCPEHPGDD